MYKLKLYITGHTPGSKILVSELKALLERNCGGEYRLEVLDVFEHTLAAYKDAVMATPTLIKTLPPPVQRIVGNLKDRERVLAALQIRTFSPNHDPNRA